MNPMEFSDVGPREGVYQVTTALRFIERDGARILQQAWVERGRGTGHVWWRDVELFREEPAPKFCKACGAEPGDDCKTASTLEVPADCINRVAP